jgi:3-methyladenine DNA glycosylase AlkD
MDKHAAMKELEALGNAATVKTYRRHNISGPTFGVRYGDMYKLQKKVGVDTALAEQLFATGNHDARVLACMIADPAEVSAKTLDAWVQAVDNQLLVDGLAGLAARHPKSAARVEKWVALKPEWQAATGWHAIAALAARADVPDAFFDRWLDVIGRDLHKSANRVRYSMNAALIAIGVRGPALRKKALRIAQQLGQVDVDHGQTSCKTPDAAAYIRKVVEHDRRRAARKAPAQKKAAKQAQGAQEQPQKGPARKPAARRKS